MEEDKKIDEFIKEKLKSDTKMTIKANEIFNEFINEENRKEKSKKKFNKKVVAMVASILVLFVGANVYATTTGNENIFFMIKNIISESTASEKELYSDKEIIISYKTIEIADGISIGVNKLQLIKNASKLYVNVSETSEDIQVDLPLKYKVYNEKNKLICSQESSKEGKENIKYEDILDLSKMKVDEKKLTLEIYSNNDNLIVTLTIDIENKVVEVAGAKEAIAKISQIELKKYLDAFALMNENYNPNKDKTLVEDKEILMAVYIVNNILEDDEEIGEGYNYQKINEIIKEVTGKEYENIIELDGIYHKNSGDKYVPAYYGEYPSALCLEVGSLSYINGIYKADFTYCYPTDGSYEDNTIEELTTYEATIKFKYNENAKYSKYQIVEMTEGKLLKKGIDYLEEITQNEEQENNSTTNSELENTNNVENSQETSSDITNYTNTIVWKTCNLSSITISYPSDWNFAETKNSQGNEYARIKGIATGNENGEITNSEIEIILYEPESYTSEELKKFENELLLRNNNSQLPSMNASTSGGLDWKYLSTTKGEERIEEYYTYINPNNSNGSTEIVKMEVHYKPYTSKGANIINYILSVAK